MYGFFFGRTPDSSPGLLRHAVGCARFSHLASSENGTLAPDAESFLSAVFRSGLEIKGENPLDRGMDELRHDPLVGRMGKIVLQIRAG